MSFTATLTAYYPTPDGHSTAENRLEGGPVDRQGQPLQTLQDFLEGKADFVSVAANPSFRYFTAIRIPLLEARYGRKIDFRIVDTGNAFKTRLDRLDICVRDKIASLDPILNRKHEVHFRT